MVFGVLIFFVWVVYSHIFYPKPAYCHGAMGILVYDVTDESSSNSMYLSLDFDKWIHLDYA